MFVHSSNSWHCQDGAICTASISEAKNNDFCHRFYGRIHSLYYFSKHITPSCSPSVRLWKDGKNHKTQITIFKTITFNYTYYLFLHFNNHQFMHFSKRWYTY